VAAILAASEDLTAEVEKLQPDVILIDTESPSRDTLENVAAMHKDMPRPVVIFTQEDHQDRQDVRWGCASGLPSHAADRQCPVNAA
jgi:response regulator NasT